MVDLEQMVLLALEDKSPSLYRQLKQAGKLREFCRERADEILEAVSDMTANDPEIRKAWSPKSGLTLIERAAIGNSRQAVALEIALATYLEFPQDETSPPERGET